MNKNIKLTLSYDGTNYNGSQSQKNQNTIEDSLKKAINKIIKKDNVKIYFSGRTDAGVHALGQVVNFFDNNKNMKTINWIYAINSLLPQDIRIVNAQFVNESFNARRSAKFREYHYTIANIPYISALDTRFSAHHSMPLNVKLLQKYGKVLIGENDFSSFCASGDQSKSKIRYIRSFKVIKKDNYVIFKIIGNAFLQHMIRIIIGTFLRAHKFNIPPKDIKQILLAKDRTKAGPTYTPRGLVLYKIYY